MVRKVTTLICVLVLIFAIGMKAQSTSVTPYEGNMSSTYITYFRDIVSGIGFNDNYVAYRSGQNEYKMVVGELTSSENVSIVL